MAIVMNLHWAAITPQLYDRANERVGWEARAPIGACTHTAWFEADGLHVQDVWDTAADFERFVAERLMPVVKGELMVEGEPTVDIKPLYRQFLPAVIRT